MLATLFHYLRTDTDNNYAWNSLIHTAFTYTLTQWSDLSNKRWNILEYWQWRYLYGSMLC